MKALTVSSVLCASLPRSGSTSSDRTDSAAWSPSLYEKYKKMVT